jgi:serine O-acetyltransferase
MFDPQTQKVELLRCELESLRKRLDTLVEDEDKRRA